jgi:hypothetical protein
MRSNLEHQIDGQRGAKLQHQPGPLERPEAAEFREDAVATGNELRREVAAVRAADRFTKDPGIFVRGR